MALKSTIYKISLQVNDFNRDYYQTHSFSLALHPSETEERMLIRLLAFSLHANEALSFTKGLSSDDEPDLWQKSLSNEIELWIELGQPDVKRLRKACGRSKQVVVYTYGGQGVELWHESIRKDLLKLSNIAIIRVDIEAIQALTKYLQRTLSVNCMIQDDTITVNIDDSLIEVKFSSLTP